MASLRLIPRCRSITSVTWTPIGTTGLSEDRGSWKIIAMSRPRRSRISLSERPSRSTPSYVAVPSTWLPRLGSNPMSASDVTDLPQPDSPTRPTVCPGWTSKETPSTALKGSSPWRVKVTRRSSTDSSGPCDGGLLTPVLIVALIASPPGLRVEGLAHATRP